MPIQTPDVVIKNAWQKIPGNIKVTFLASFLIGLITHTYMITNTLPNHDEFKNMAENIAWATRGTGRWFSMVAGSLGGIFTLPWFNGLMLIVFFAISSCLVVTMAKVKNYFYCALISGIMITIPMVASFMTYMGVIPINIGSILLSTLAAFIAVRYKFGYIFATIPIVLSLALYQVSISITAALMVMVLILQVLDNQTSWQKTLFKGIRFIGTLITGLLLYFASIRIIYPDGIPTDYQGIREMGQIDWANLPNLIRTAYIEILRFFLEDTRNYHFSFMNILFVLSFVACATLVIMICIRKKIYEEPLKLVLLGVLILLFPFACNLVYIMGAHWIHDLMIYATVFILVFVIVIVDRYVNLPKEEAPVQNRKNGSSSIIASISIWVISITMAISLYNYVILSNQVYFKLNIGYQVTFAQSILLISNIQSVEGYTEDKDIVIVGSKYIPEGIPELQHITIMGANGPEFLLDSWAYPYFLRRHLNFTQNIRHVRGGDIWHGHFHGVEEIIELARFVEDMPVYPADGSIKIVDNTIYVRFAHLDLPPYRDWGLTNVD